MLNRDEQIDILTRAMKRCRHAIEDGWEEDDFNFIARDIKKVFLSISEKLGWPKELEIEKKIGELKSKYSTSRSGLENAKQYLISMEKEWINKIGEQV